MIRLATVALVIPAAAIAVAGCGGSSHKTVASQPPVTTPTIPLPTSITSTTASTATTKQSQTTTTKTPSHPAPHHEPHREQPRNLGPVLTAAVLAQKANAACASYRAKASALSRPPDFSSNAKAASAYLTKLLALKRTEIDHVHFNPPRTEEVPYARFLAGLLHQNLLLSLANNEALGGRSYTSDYQSSISYVHSVLNALARQLKFTSCIE